MRYTKLGRTGLDCSLLGFGTWQIGGGRWKGLEPQKSIQLLQQAIDSGINLFDAAIVYGQYRGELNEARSHSLELMGKAFEGNRRAEVLVCLKVGQIDEYSHKADYNPFNIVEQVKRALKQLKTEYIDICLIHAPTISQIQDGRALAVMQTLQALGIARFIGYSFEAEPEHAKLALTQNIDVMMLQYNLLEEACSTVFDAANSRGIGVLVGGPFKRGYLCGRYESIGDLPLEDNYWEWNVRYAKKKVEALLNATSLLKKQAGGAIELRKKALHHIIKHPGANCIVVGHRLEEEVIENARLIDEIVFEMHTV